MTGRIIWYAVLAAIAALTAGLQLDMHSKRAPALASLVPDVLRNHAQVQITRQALAGTDSALALAEAKTLVHRRPVPAEHLALLAAAQVKAGRLDGAGLTIQIAGKRGWREPAAQEAVLRLAVAAGDKREAAKRYAALFLNDRTPDALLAELGPAVLGGPDDVGRETMVAIVRGGERWHALFLRRGTQVMPPAAFSIIAASSLLEGAQFDCSQLAQSLRALERRDPTAANQLALAAAGRCPKLAPKGTFPL